MRVVVIGAGPGAADMLPARAADELAAAQYVIGAQRLLSALSCRDGVTYIACTSAADIGQHVRQCSSDSRVCILVSGDPGLYSLAAQLPGVLPEAELVFLPGISSVQCLAARLGRPWQNWRIVSAHAAAANVLGEVLNHPAVFFLTGAGQTAEHIIAELCDAELGDAAVTVGQNLGCAQERIIAGRAAELHGRSFSSLCVVLVENTQTFLRPSFAPGIPDAEFIRGAAPMTKREVRALALSLLCLAPNALVYDIGAGTGSVAVEMALAARWGRVWAVESAPERCTLVQQNKQKFGAWNMTVVQGAAPAALDALPAPDAVFVGGSGGALPDITAAVLAKNPAVRIVLAAAALQTLAAAQDAFCTHGLTNVQTVQISAARGVERGRYTLLEPQTPVFLLAGGGQ